uniref:YtcA family lipoprotein n=1 Tax=Shigella sp. FC1967 TaxID=1898041 RepID=UPI002570CF39|nr:YtcA family lipoprotein [Shigella sp. FC1967]
MSIIVLLLSGCSQGHSPFITMLGAYFPYWMLCTVIGLLGTLIIRVLLIYLGIDDKLPLPLIFYFAILLSIFFNYLFYFYFFFIKLWIKKIKKKVSDL